MLDFKNAKNWVLTESTFDPTALGKVEANFCLGNGYLGLRSATEEYYPGETRDLLIAGTFDRFSPEEVTELPNAADVTNIEITLDGERFDMTKGDLLSYERSLNIRNGLLTRDVEWRSPRGKEYVMRFERIVSLKRLHSIAMRISIIPKADAVIAIRSGIDGRMTCDGSQHFTEGQTRFYDKQYLQYVPRTIQSNISFVLNASHHFTLDGKTLQPESDINILRRRMFSNFTLPVKAGQTLVMEKNANVYTTRDREAEGKTLPELQTFALSALKRDEKLGFAALAKESAQCWEEKVWARVHCIEQISMNKRNQIPSYAE